MRNLIMVIGGTATGKTTFIKRRYENHEGVSYIRHSGKERCRLRLGRPHGL